VIGIAEQKVTDFISLPHTWNGLAFDRKGTTLIVSGGSSKQLHLFQNRDGKVSGLRSIAIEHEDLPLFIAGIAVHPVGRIFLREEMTECCGDVTFCGTSLGVCGLKSGHGKIHLVISSPGAL